MKSKLCGNDVLSEAQQSWDKSQLDQMIQREQEIEFQQNWSRLGKFYLYVKVENQYSQHILGTCV